MATTAPSDPSPKPTTSTKTLTQLLTTPPDSLVAHTNRLLSTASGIDSTLLFLGYSLYLTSASLRRLAALPNPRLALLQRLSALLPAAAAPQVKNPDRSYADALARAADSTKAFGALCSEVRMFMRLWGILKIYAAARAARASPPPDAVLRVLGWCQLGLMAGYLALEGPFFLASKGVVKGFPAERVMGWFRTSIAIYGAYIVCDYVRLWRVWRVREEERRVEDRGGKGEVTAREREAQDAAWWRSLQVNMAYSPLCLHWGGVGLGDLGDAGVGLLGAWAGWVGFKEAWRVTA